MSLFIESFVQGAGFCLGILFTCSLIVMTIYLLEVIRGE